MSTTFLLTVGTSLITNREAQGLDDTALLARLTANPVAASAEANVLSRMDRAAGDRCVFLHSQTDDGARCGRLLARHFAGEPVEITGLTYQESSFASQGLRSLVQILCREVRKARRAGHEVILLPQGGFKAETAYATLIGVLFHLRMFYVHETFKTLIPLPAAPVSWDLGLFADYERFFTWLDQEPRLSQEVGDWLKALGDDEARVQALLEPDDEGHVWLSAMGEAYFEAFREIVETGAGDTVYLSGKAQEAYQRAPELFDPILKRLALSQIRQTRGRIRGNVRIFPQGHVDGRAAYVERGEGVFVLELVRHGTDYDRLNDQLKGDKLAEIDYPFSVATPWISH